MIIADCNLIAYLHLPGPQTGLAEGILSKDADWRVPPLWRPEFRNVLFAYVRTKGMTLAVAETHWNDALSHLAKNQSEPEPTRILAKAAATKLSAYDAEYVALAEQLGRFTRHGGQRNPPHLSTYRPRVGRLP